MKYKTAFRLALRAIGVFLIAQSLPQLLVNLGALALTLLSVGVWGGSSSGLLDWRLQTFLMEMATTIAGLYLFFGGTWIVNRAIPSNRPYCHECGYEITGLPPEGLCPECGTAYQRRGE